MRINGVQLGGLAAEIVITRQLGAGLCTLALAAVPASWEAAATTAEVGAVAVAQGLLCGCCVHSCVAAQARRWAALCAASLHGVCAAVLIRWGLHHFTRTRAAHSNDAAQ